MHKINKFCQGQTRSLEQRLQKLQERAAEAEGSREKEALLRVRGPGRAGPPRPRSPAWARSPPTCERAPCWQGTLLSAPRRAACAVQEAKEIGDEFLALEKYVNLNYMGEALPSPPGGAKSGC